MRSVADVEQDIWEAEMDIESAKDRLQDLEDERVRVEDREAEEHECKLCEGTGSSEEEELDYTCPDCGGSGEI